MAISKPKKFEVTARLIIMCGLTITAENIEDAMVQARKLKERDFVKFLGEHYDGSIAITSITKPDSWNTDQDGL